MLSKEGSTASIVVAASTSLLACAPSVLGIVSESIDVGISTRRAYVASLVVSCGSSGARRFLIPGFLGLGFRPESSLG